jgi:hypothetical protein
MHNQLAAIGVVLPRSETSFHAPASYEQLDASHLRQPSASCDRGRGVTAVGQEHAFPRPRLSARCRFSQGTFAGMRGYPLVFMKDERHIISIFEGESSMTEGRSGR